VPESWFEVDGYRLRADRYYDAERHLWVELRPGTLLARVGFDPLGRETSGDIAMSPLVSRPRGSNPTRANKVPGRSSTQRCRSAS
jgi:hypothetical protein